MGASNTNWSLLLTIVIFHVSWTNGQRRAVVHYDVSRSTSIEVPETFSENPVSSSINSIQTGREELIAFHKGETGLGVDPRRGFSKPTTPDYSEEFVADGDGAHSGKTPNRPHPHSSESDTGIIGNIPQNRNNDSLKGYKDLAASRDRRHQIDTKNERDSAFETLSSSSRRNGSYVSTQEKHSSEKQPRDGQAEVEASRPDHFTTERNTPHRGEEKVSMDDNKGTPLREHDRRTNPSESRRQTTTPSSLPSGRFNTPVKEDKHREDLPEKSHNERLNRERRPPVSAENTRGQRSSEKPSFDKPQATHTPASRTPTTERHDRIEQPSVPAASHERKILDLPVDGRDTFGVVDEKTKDLSRESDHRDKTYQTENDRTKPKEDRPVSTVLNKPTRLDIGGRTVDPSSVYTDAFRGNTEHPDGKIVPEAEKSSSGGGEGKAYVDKHYGPADERSPAHRSRHTDRDYNRRHRDQYDDRSYVERPLRDSQTHRDRNATYASQDRAANRGYRPRDDDYDERYKDSEYPYRDTTKDTGYTARDRTRRIDERHQYGRSDYDTGDRYAGDRNYKDYTDERWYREESDRDSTRRYSDEDSRKHRSDGRRVYDDYDDSDRSRDHYDRRYERDGELRNYGDNDTRRYEDSDYRRHDVDDTRIYREEYDRPVRRYKDEDEYKLNSTRRYREDYDTYRDDDRGISTGSRTSHRYDEGSGTRITRYDDDEDYRGSRGYSTRDSDQKYAGTSNDGSSRQRNSSRKVLGDDVRRLEDDGSRRYHDDTRTYVESSSKDRYGQDDNRRLIEEHGSPAFSGTLSYQDRTGASTRRGYDDTSRHKESNSSRRSHGNSDYRSRPRAEDEYYDSSASSGNVDKYESSSHPRRTDDDSLGLPDRDDTSRQYSGRSSNERRRDRIPADIPDGRRVPDAGYPYKDRARPYDEDYRNDRSRIDSYDEQRYRSRHYDDHDEKYVGSSDDRIKKYDTRPYRDVADDTNTRNYRAKGDAGVGERYRGDDTTKDRIVDDPFEKPRRVSGRNQEPRYSGRSYDDDRYGDDSYEGTHHYGTGDERHPSTSSDGRRPEYRNPDRRNRDNQKFYDDYDVPQERDSTISRSTEEKRRGEKPNRREDSYASEHPDFDGKIPSRPKTDKGIRGDGKSVIQARGTDISILKGETGSPYEEEALIDGMRSHTRGTQPEGRTHRAGYASHSDNRPPKSRTSGARLDNVDKGDFAKGRRTPFYSEDDKTDSDRDEDGKVLTDDKHFRRTEENKGVSYPRNESRSSTYNTTDSRTADRADSKPNSEGQAYSRRVDVSDSNRRTVKNETPISRAPVDLLPASGNVEYTDRKEDAEKPPISQRNKETPRTRYSSTSDERGSRRRLPNSREPEVDKPTRRDDTEYKSEYSFSPEGQRRYHYTKSRGDPEDFSRHDDEGGEEYISRGTSSKGHDSGRRDMPKGDFGNTGSGTPTRNKDERISEEPGYKDKDGRYPVNRERVSLQNGKAENDSRTHKEFGTKEEVSYDRNNSSRDERRMYETRDRDRSSSQDELRNRDEDTSRDQFDNFKREIHANKENDRISPIVPHTIPIVRDEGLSVSRSATPIPHNTEKDFIRRNTSSRITDRISGVPVNREKHFHYDDAHNTSRSATGVNDELSKRPLTTKEVIEAAHRYSDEPEKQKEIYYPVYVPTSSNMTSPDIIRPGDRRGITTPTKKKKKK